MNDDLKFMVMRIAEVGKARAPHTVERRLLKVAEELGEVSEAVLGYTCPLNYKQKTVEDIREEAIDALIVLVDIALTRMPGSNHVPITLLPQIIDGGRLAPLPIEQFDKAVFATMKSVANAASAFSHDDDMGFYGALSLSIGRMASIAYSSMGEDDVGAKVWGMFVAKIGKWIAFLDKMEQVKYNEAA